MITMILLLLLLLTTILLLLIMIIIVMMMMMIIIIIMIIGMIIRMILIIIMIIMIMHIISNNPKHILISISWIPIQARPPEGLRRRRGLRGRLERAEPPGTPHLAWDDTVGNLARARIYELELFELTFLNSSFSSLSSDEIRHTDGSLSRRAARHPSLSYFC